MAQTLYPQKQHSFFYRANLKEIPIRLEKIGELASRIDAQSMKNGRLQQMMKNFDVPTVDVYIELKLSLGQLIYKFSNF